ncbi:CoA pyrophosphatase [Pelagerythrobacter aerophilus]|uniref:CoA pyrophosphatase n=1 Tax=Pelagerythrobacter aerophilus TaxID=2306995 RepID=A0A418NI61_9SPHN|nr:CoA pyrophosphatase [Pelagerythrobacter aerophilus]RIV78651.1 CoA pyrophosphatase [Pelagerythrobacter aerophilus]
MNSLFDRLEALFEQGHRADIPDLLTDERFADAGRTADAAVLIAVTDRPSPGLILTQRPHDMRDHPGQVAFPGGKIDPGETAIEAALREAEEELSMRPGDVRVIGTTDQYQTGTGFDVTPVLGVVPPDLPLVANPGEVEAWFEAPLDLLLDRANWTEHEVFWRGATRRYLEYHYDGFRIWGVTAAIIANLARRIEYKALFDG